jgi:hypothetical protein
LLLNAKRRTGQSPVRRWSDSFHSLDDQPRPERTGGSVIGAGVVLVSVDIVVELAGVVVVVVVLGAGVLGGVIGGALVFAAGDEPWSDALDVLDVPVPAVPDELEPVVCAYEKPMALTTASVAIAEARDLRDFIFVLLKWKRMVVLSQDEWSPSARRGGIGRRRRTP